MARVTEAESRGMTVETALSGRIAPEPDECVEMYRQMVLIRHFEELALKLRQEGLIHGVVHSYSGQEAIAVGVCANLRTTDRIVSNHRGDRKSTRLNSSHQIISYAVFCLKK